MDVSAVVVIGTEIIKLAVVEIRGGHGFLGAFRYLSTAISKYSSSLPLASATPVTSMFAPDKGDEIPPTSKKRKPDWVPCGSTALAANWEDSISSICFLLIAPFTFERGRGIG